ncbi:MAG: hypothetical protein ACFFD2_08390, partial [Promethearchaeota archaeon]
MNPFELNDNFCNALDIATNKLKSWIEDDKIIRYSSHIDADGLSAAGIVCSALFNLNARFHLRILKQLEPEFIESLAKEKRNCYIFSDFGSAQVKYLMKHIPTKEIIILDHHEPINISKKPPNIIEINPLLFGIDGSNEISGAGVSFLFVYNLDPQKNLDLLPLALV